MTWRENSKILTVKTGRGFIPLPVFDFLMLQNPDVPFGERSNSLTLRQPSSNLIFVRRWADKSVR